MELQTLQEALKVEIQVHQVICVLSCFILLSNSSISIADSITTNGSIK